MKQFEVTYKNKKGPYTVVIEATSLANASTVATELKPPKTRIERIREVQGVVNNV